MLVQRRVHWEAQALLFNLIHRLDIVVVIFSLLLIPGVFLHEISHYLMAKLLGVSTGNLSLLPKSLPNGKLSLGYVETEKVDFIRDGLIGLAPLLSGSTLIGFIGTTKLHLIDIWITMPIESWQQISSAITILIQQPDFWIWFYLILAISSTMIPSASDRRSWLIIGSLMSFFGITIWLVGGGFWLLNALRDPSNWIVRSFNLVLSLSLMTHVLIWLPLLSLRILTTRKRDNFM